MTKTILVCDANSLGWAAHHVRELRRADGRAVQAVGGLLRSLLKRAKEFNALPVILWDGRAQWRYDLYPGYKSDREKTEEQLKSREEYNWQVPQAMWLMSLLGLAQLRSPSAEADDVASFLVTRLVELGYQVIMVTADSDWYRMVQPGVTHFDPRVERAITVDNFQEVVGYTSPLAYIHGKALIGDTSDTIVGIDGYGKAKSQALMNQHGSMDAFYAGVDNGSVVVKGVLQNRLITPESREIVSRNIKLMDLALTPPEPMAAIKLSRFERNEEVFKQRCAHLELAEISDYHWAYFKRFPEQGLLEQREMLEGILKQWALPL